jgi:hypothetical protein
MLLFVLEGLSSLLFLLFLLSLLSLEFLASPPLLWVLPLLSDLSDPYPRLSHPPLLFLRVLQGPSDLLQEAPSAPSLPPSLSRPVAD